MKRNINNVGLDSSKKKIEIKSYCPQDIARVQTLEGALSRTFSIAELYTAKKVHVHIRAYVDFYGGYAEHGRQILFRLGSSGLHSGQFVKKLTPIKSIIDTDPFITQKSSSYVFNPAFNIDESIFLSIAGPGWMQDKFLPKSRYSIGWTMIESLNCHPDIAEYLKSLHEIWAPTMTDHKRFSRLKIKPTIRVMNLGYDHRLYNRKVQGMQIREVSDRFVFGVLGSWNKRKGIKAIIQAYCHAFKSTDNVSLLLVCKYANRPYDGIKDGEEVQAKESEKWDIVYELKRYCKNFTDIPHICLIDIPIHENVLPHILARFSCLVGFSMGESTWLPGLQAMATGVPVIQLKADTNGFIDYMNEDNSYLCKDVRYEVADDELVKGTSEYYEGEKFAVGDTKELAEKMREVRLDSAGRLKKIDNGEQSVKHWTWDRSAERVADRLVEIKRWL